MYAVESAVTADAIITALREHAHADPLAGRLIPSQLAEADEVADLALELTRLRMRLPHADRDLLGLENLFTRASVKLAELLDANGLLNAYKARDARRPPLPPGARFGR